MIIENGQAIAHILCIMLSDHDRYAHFVRCGDPPLSADPFLAEGSERLAYLTQIKDRFRGGVLSSAVSADNASAFTSVKQGV